MQPKLIITFERVGEAKFGGRASNIVNHLKDNAHFPGPWPDYLPSWTTLKKAFDDYSEAAIVAARGSRMAIAQRNELRKTLSDHFKKLAPYLESVANGDLAKLVSTGYELRRDRLPATGPGLPPAPLELRLKHGELTGTLIARAKPVKGAGSYEVQIGQGDSGVEENWRAAAISKVCSRMVLEGLVPGTLYHVRIRAIGSRGAGAWSDAASLMAM